MGSKKIIFIVGPTAVGKTQIAFLLARKIKGEIISCDAMQAYREVSIATCKPPRAFLKQVPHHLVNSVSIRQEFDVVSFERKARAAIRKVQKKGRIPIVAGGSGLYMSVLLDGIFKGPPADENIRKKFMRREKRRGSGFLYGRLKKIDPASAKRIHPHDLRRIIRALEVYTITKQPISRLQKKRNGLWGRQDIVIFGLNRRRNELYDKIEKRVDGMFKEAVIEEIKSLMGKKWSRTSDNIIAVKEIKGYLNGEYDLERTKYLVKLNTRHYAKRQLTWFKKDKRIKWVAIKKRDTPSRIVAFMTQRIKKS